MKDEKGNKIINAFQTVLKETNRKPNKIWVGKSSEFYNRSMNSWIEKMTLKNEKDKLDVVKLVPAPVDLSKTTDVIKIIL